MPALTLPSTFQNSFWTPDYRRGIETLIAKLEQGVHENHEIILLIKNRANAEYAIASQLISTPESEAKGRGFTADEGASMLLAFRGLQAEARVQGEAHRTIAKELEELVAEPFVQWAESHKKQIQDCREEIVDGWLGDYGLAQGQVAKLKQQYLSKMRRADDAADDAKFAPNAELSDSYTTSPRLVPHDHPHPTRTASVSERISQRFKEIHRNANVAVQESISGVIMDDKRRFTESSETSEGSVKRTGKGKERAVEEQDAVLASPPFMSPTLPPPKADMRGASPKHPPHASSMLIAELSLSPTAVSNLLKRAAADLPMRSVKIPILGEYKDCFSGEQFVLWLVNNVHDFGGSFDQAETAARELTEREGLIRRIGELGNEFEGSDEAMYQFRPKAFNLDAEHVKGDPATNTVAPVISNFAPLTTNLAKRSTDLVNMVSKAIGERNSEPFHVRARAEADAADREYREAVRKLDKQRLILEERLEDALKNLQGWETNRLHAVKTVLLQYQGTLANLPSSLNASLGRSATLIASYLPETDLRALMERYSTGPFSPVPQVYETLTHEEADVYFGIDLRKWADSGWDSLRGDAELKDNIPEVLVALLGALISAYPKLPDDDQRRKAWIYEVPLSAVHHLRERLNDIPSGKPLPEELLAQYNVPVLASTVKLWMLELNPPLAMWEGWDEFRRVYQSAATAGQPAPDQRIQDLQNALIRLPRVNLLVLNAIFSHLRNLIDTTTMEEDNEIYMTKLSLSMGRTVLRPKFENEFSLHDRHPTMLFTDLLKHYNEIIPPALAKKKHDSERTMPTWKRTTLVDMRMSRSKLSVSSVDMREALEEQLLARNPNARPSPRAPNAASSPQVEMKPMQPLSATLQAAVEDTPVKLASPHVPILKKLLIEQPDVPMPQRFVEPSAEQPEERTLDSPRVEEPPIATMVMPAEDPKVPLSMPSFKEPPPEDDYAGPPPMPKFVELAPEEGETISSLRSPASQVSPAPMTVPSPIATSAVPLESHPRPPTTLSAASNDGGTVSPTSSAVPDFARQSGGASLHRSGSNETSRLRGPRGARLQGARQSPGTSVASMVSNLNRNPASSPPGSAAPQRSSYRVSDQYGGRSASPVNPQDYEPKGRRAARTSAGNFGRRAMASDAEDDATPK